MFRQTILTVALSLVSLAPTSVGAGVQVEMHNLSDTTVVSNENYAAKGDWVNSEEVNTVQESELTRRELQLQKAHNAEEYDSSGAAITIIAMCIVLGALVVLSILFLIFGKISSRALTRKKKKAHGVDDLTADEHHEELDSGEVIAAIGLALAEHFGQGHDMEDTILTIRRMRKAYSPWNSKIYNMRHLPNLNASERRSLNS